MVLWYNVQCLDGGEITILEKKNLIYTIGDTVLIVFCHLVFYDASLENLFIVIFMNVNNFVSMVLLLQLSKS